MVESFHLSYQWVGLIKRAREMTTARSAFDRRVRHGARRRTRLNPLGFQNGFLDFKVDFRVSSGFLDFKGNAIILKIQLKYTHDSL